MNERNIIKSLAERYLKLIGMNQDQHLRNMCLTIIDKINTMDTGRMNRWLGFIQKSIIDLKLTTIVNENKFSAILFEQFNKDIKDKSNYVIVFKDLSDNKVSIVYTIIIDEMPTVSHLLEILQNLTNDMNIEIDKQNIKNLSIEVIPEKYFKETNSL